MARYGICLQDGCGEIVELPARHCPAHPPPRSPSSHATSEPGWKQKRREVLLRDGGMCQMCGLPGATNVDHIVSAANGGTSDLENLRAICWSCNRRKGG